MNFFVGGNFLDVSNSPAVVPSFLPDEDESASKFYSKTVMREERPACVTPVFEPGDVDRLVNYEWELMDLSGWPPPLHIEPRAYCETQGQSMWRCDVCGVDISDARSTHELSTLHVFSKGHSPCVNPVMLSESNVGYRMLERMGWIPASGAGLGAQSQGRLHPVPTLLKLDRRGLGARPAPPVLAPVLCRSRATDEASVAQKTIRNLGRSKRTRVTHFPAHVETRIVSRTNTVSQRAECGVQCEVSSGAVVANRHGIAMDVHSACNHPPTRSLAMIMQDAMDRIRVQLRRRSRIKPGITQSPGDNRKQRRQREVHDKEKERRLRIMLQPGPELPNGLEKLLLDQAPCRHGR